MKKKSYKINKDQKSEYFDHKEAFNNQHLHNKMVSILPHPVTLESYEEICPGITNKLSSFILKEQEHRHKIEKLKLKKSANFYYFGQLLAVLLFIMVIYGTFLMMEYYKNSYLAAIFAFSGFTSLAMMNFFALRCKNTHTNRQDKYRFKKKTSS
jgi:uncharacterized membrane protein